MSSQRLSIETLPAASGDFTPPRRDPHRLSIGIVHFGIGAFHRAHQAVFTEDAAAVTGENGWGILGVTGRTDAVVAQMRPQDCLYGVLERGATRNSLRLIASIRDVAWPGEDSELVAETVSRPTTHVITLTITEKGYLRGADGAVDLSLPAVRHDLSVVEGELAGASAPNDSPASQTPIGLLVRGLARRFRSGGEPVSIVSCDNIVDNGSMTKTLVTSFVAAIGRDADGAHGAELISVRDRMLAWLAESVAFPSTMVDRISPATKEADHEEEFALLGLRDDALVVAEPFLQWVIEDRFAGPRPAWEKAGAILTDDVTPYERVKLRILNATHSFLAYAGALKGYRTIAETVADPAMREMARRIIDEDILPTLEAPEGIDLAEYRDSVLERFANPNLAHTTLQVGMDGSQKLPNRLLGTVIDRLDAGRTPLGLALVVAAWIGFVASTLADGGPTLDDPLAERLQQAAGSADAALVDPAGLVERMLAIDAIFPDAIRDSQAFREAVVSQLPVIRALTLRP